MSLRLGLAGLGVHGSRYAAHLLRGDVPGARLTVVCRRDGAAGRAFAEQHGITAVERPEELAERNDVDAVVLVLPPDLHSRAAMACVENDRPVLVEKPLAHDLDSARALAEASERRAALLMVGQTLRFDPLVERLRERAESIGPLRSFYLNQRFEPSDRPWLDRRGPGGLLLNTGVHGFDLMRHLTGLEAEAVVSLGSAVETRRTEDRFACLIRLAGDVPAVVENSRTTRSRSGRIELVGRDGQLWGDHIHRTLTVVEGRTAREIGPVRTADTIPATLSAFAECVRAGTPPPIGVLDGLATLEIVEAARRAVDEQRWVTLAEIRA